MPVSLNIISLFLCLTHPESVPHCSLSLCTLTYREKPLLLPEARIAQTRSQNHIL